VPSEKQTLVYLRVLVGLASRAAATLRDSGASKAGFHAAFNAQVADLESQSAEAAGISAAQAQSGIRAHASNKAVILQCSKLQLSCQPVVRTLAQAAGLSDAPDEAKSQVVVRFLELSLLTMNDVADGFSEFIPAQVVLEAVAKAVEEATAVFCASEGIDEAELARLTAFFTRNPEVAQATAVLQAAVAKVQDLHSSGSASPGGGAASSGAPAVTPEAALEMLKAHSNALTKLVMQLGLALQGRDIPDSSCEAAVISVFQQHQTSIVQQACVDSGVSLETLQALATSASATLSDTAVQQLQEGGAHCLQNAIKVAAAVIRANCSVEEAMEAEGFTAADFVV
jgi:hypothetical protein